MVAFRVVIAVGDKSLCNRIEKVLATPGTGVACFFVNVQKDEKVLACEIRGLCPDLIILDQPYMYWMELENFAAILISSTGDSHFRGQAPTGEVLSSELETVLLEEVRKVVTFNNHYKANNRHRFICRCDRFEQMFCEEDRTEESIEEVKQAYHDFLEKENFEDSLTEFRVFERDGKFGLADALGHIIHQADYDEISLDGIARKGDKWGVLDLRNACKILYPFVYDSIEALGCSQYLKMKLNGKYKLCDTYRFDLNAEVFDSLMPVGYHDEIIVEKEGKKGLIAYGRVVPALYDQILVPRLVGWVHVCLNGKWGYIDVKGEFTNNLHEADLHLLDPDICLLS